MEFDVLKRYLDYSGAFYELFGYVDSIYDRERDNVEVERIYEHIFALKDELERKYLNSEV